jgi:hypothetical protein
MLMWKSLISPKRKVATDEALDRFDAKLKEETSWCWLSRRCYLWLCSELCSRFEFWQTWFSASLGLRQAYPISFLGLSIVYFFLFLCILDVRHRS